MSGRPLVENEYAELASKFDELVECGADDPRHGELRDELVRRHIPVAEHVAQRFRHRGVAVEDLRQVAMLGLVNAVDRYDPARGNDFLAFAVPTIMGEVRRHFRDAGWPMRVPRRLKDLHLRIGKAIDELSQRTGKSPKPAELAEYLGVDIEEVRNGLEAGYAYHAKSLSDGGEGGEEGSLPLVDRLGVHDEHLDEVEYRQTLSPLLAELPERERRILRLRFFENMTQSEIASRVGLSQMHVSRLLNQTLQQLRARISERP